LFGQRPHPHLYVANNADGDAPGIVSVINRATCNGADISGCSSTTATVVVGRSPRLVAIDTTTDRVYVTDHSSAAVSLIDGSTCNANVTTGPLLRDFGVDFVQGFHLGRPAPIGRR
jgi:DNA-binding beta-propeller fold protein YncE